MQQLVIKLSPEATQQYLTMASNKTQPDKDRDMEVSDINLDINLAIMAGLTFADIGVNGQSIKTQSDDEDLKLELVELN